MGHGCPQRWIVCWDKVSLAPSLIIIGQWQQSEERQLTINPKQSNWTTMSHVIFQLSWTWVHKFSWNLFETRLNVSANISIWNSFSSVIFISFKVRGTGSQRGSEWPALGYSQMGIDKPPKGTRCLVSDLTLGTLIHKSRIIQQNPKHDKQKPRFKSVFLNVCKSRHLTSKLPEAQEQLGSYRLLELHLLSAISW